MAEVSLEKDGIVVALPQCACDSEDCKKREQCVIREPADGDFFPHLSMRSGDPTKSDPYCYGDCTIVCTSYRKE